jgi:site-specific DNA-methyltransferase (adenine-specific)
VNTIDDVLSGRAKWCVVTGDCLDVLRTIPAGSVDAVVTDPPYGVAFDTDYTRFTKDGKQCGLATSRVYKPVHGDKAPFDPTPWLAFPKTALFGANCFSDRLPIGAWCVWCKKLPDKYGTFMSDAEPCWISTGHGVWIKQHEWDGFLMDGEERRQRHHPTEKPAGVMAWIMDRLGVEVDSIVIDPYAGSGSTGVACMQTGRRFIGIEIDEGYATIARRRIAEAENHLFAGSNA